MNGKIEESELVGPMGTPYKPYFAMIDTNHDGFIEPQELMVAQAVAAQRRQQTPPPAQGSAATPAAPAATGKPTGD